MNPNPPTWIPCSEQLPEKGLRVLLWDGRHQVVGYRYGQWFAPGLYTVTPTHWMPLLAVGVSPGHARAAEGKVNSMTKSVTQETVAGACGLDGEELTHELLLENQRLLVEVKDLRRQNEVGFWVWIVTFAAFIVALFYGALR
jgi:hypothetical protein